MTAWKIAIWRAAGVLTTSELATMLAIREASEPPNARQLREAVGEQFTSASVSSLIDSLVRRGLVRRERDAVDRRMIRLSLTEEAMDLPR